MTKKTKKRTNRQDLTLRNLNAIKKAIESLKRKITGKKGKKKNA